MEDKKKNKRIHKVNIQTKNEKDCNWLGLHEKCFTKIFKNSLIMFKKERKIYLTIKFLKVKIIVQDENK